MQNTQRPVVAPQQQSQLAGQFDRLLVDPHQQMLVDQVQHCGRRLGESPDGRPVREPLQHRAGGGRGGQQGTAQAGGVRGECGRGRVQLRRRSSQS
jgi:hypothetical protein